MRGSLSFYRWHESFIAIKGITTEVQAEDLRDYFNQEVVVSGMLEYRPSGQALRIDADSSERSTGNVVALSKVPRALSPQSFAPLRQPQTPQSGLTKIIGKWQGDESDEQIEELLELIS